MLEASFTTAARRTILAGKGALYYADNCVMSAAEIFLLGALRIPGMPANDDHGRQPTVELMASKRRKGWPTRDAAPRLDPVQEVYKALIERRAEWLALLGVTAWEDGNGDLEIPGKYFLPRNLAENPKDLLTGKRITAAELFCRLALCTQAELPYVVNERLKLGIHLSELEPDPAKIKPNGSDSTPEPGAKAKKKPRKKQGAPAGERMDLPPVDSEEAFIAGMLPEATEPFRRTEKGGITTTSQYNMRLAVAKLGVKLSYDSFAARMLITEGERTQALGDAETERLFLTVDERFGFLPHRELFWMVIRDIARWGSFHPVRDYLDLLQWDQKPRLDTWLTAYAGADDTQYIRAVGRLILIAAVRRIRQPGVKFDEMLVLEGPQGNNKSSALAVLAVRPGWFSDDLPLNCTGKEVIERTSGKWIVEAAELSGMRQGIVEHIKGFLSRQIDTARMAYGRMPTERPRQFVVIGSTNARTYLKDSTGNRRFWPVRVKGFDLEALARDRDQLWAEAVEAEEEEEAIRLDPGLYSAAGAQQDKRKVLEPWLEVLHTAIGHIKRGKMMSESAWTIVNRPIGQLTQADNQRLGEAMQLLGWEHDKPRFRIGKKSRTHWGYVVEDGSEVGIPLPEVTATRDETGALHITIRKGERDDAPDEEDDDA